MRFPAVTVCNANPLRKSLYQFSAELKNKLEERDNDTCFRQGNGLVDYFILLKIRKFSKFNSLGGA